jgi:hypothetical protein
MSIGALDLQWLPDSTVMWYDVPNSGLKKAALFLVHMIANGKPRACVRGDL